MTLANYRIQRAHRSISPEHTRNITIIYKDQRTNSAHHHVVQDEDAKAEAGDTAREMGRVRDL